MLSLSTCWNSHRHSDGRALAGEAAELGFSTIEVSHGCKISLLPGLLDAVRAGEIRVSSLHNFCPAPVETLMDAPDLYEFTSAKTWERERAVTLTTRTIEMAARFGAGCVVLHLGRVPMGHLTERLEQMALKGDLYSRAYVATKLDLVAKREKLSVACLDRVRVALDALLPHCEAHQVRLGIETRSHYEQIPNPREMVRLLDDYRDCPWIGAWYDFGHAQRQANLALLNSEQYLTEIAPRLIGCHMHDVEWPVRDHRTPLSVGGVDWPRLLPLLPAGIPRVWELSPGNSRARVTEALARWRQAFPHEA
jgi:sugar phosphate isomerase/epimerase